MAQVNFKLIYEKTTWVEVDIIYDIILRCVYGQKVLLPTVDEKKTSAIFFVANNNVLQ